MGQQFDRVAIVAPGGKENVILASQLIVDYGQGPGSQGGVITVKDGFVDHLGAGDSSARRQEPGTHRTAPPRHWHVALFKLKEESNANV